LLHDADKRQAMGEAGRRRILAGFTQQQALDALASRLHSLAGVHACMPAAPSLAAGNLAAVQAVEWLRLANQSEYLFQHIARLARQQPVRRPPTLLQRFVRCFLTPGPRLAPFVRVAKRDPAARQSGAQEGRAMMQSPAVRSAMQRVSWLAAALLALALG
jgi:hypothetical protein